MARLIDADVLIKALKEAPTIDPVKHGEWRGWDKGGTYHYENYGTCSVCHEDAEIGTEHETTALIAVQE